MKRILFFLMAVVYSIVFQAAKAHPGPFTVTQSDGTQVTVKIHGDEDFHYYTTLDGVILFRDGNDYFVASISDNGEIINSGQLAHNASSRSTEEISIVSKQDKTKFFASATKKINKAKANRTALVEDDKTLFPHEGNPKVLVALVQSSDVKFTVNEPKKAFDQYLNAQRGKIENLGNYNTRNAGSVAQYFDDASFGKFRPQFDVLDPITLDNTLVHYGEGKNDKMSLLIPDVCKAIDENINFKDYDQNNDGKVDLIYIIYAGYSAGLGGNSTDCIWPKSGTGPFGTYDGKSVYRYGVSNELNYNPGYKKDSTGKELFYINGIGLFCHEFSHCMGMPDLYATKAATEETQNSNNQEMEYWSIMDLGTYLQGGYVPAAYTAWEREFFGWMDIEDITDAKAQVIEMKAIDKGGKAYRIRNTNDESGNEYYILENIQKYGWNYYQFGQGMLAIHVDYDPNIFSLRSNSVNNTLGHPRMTVLAADGMLLNENSGDYTPEFIVAQAGGDPFPGTSNVTSLTDETSVRPKIYTGERFGKPIYDIMESADGIITFKYLDPTVTSIKDAIVEKKHKDNKIYTLDGRYIGTNADGLNKGIYIIGNKKVVIR